MLLPVPLPSETLYSLVSRLAITNGLSRKDIEISSKKKMYQRSADIEMDLSAFTIFTNGVYGNPNELIENFTQGTFFEIAGDNLIGFSNKNRNIWRWCEACLEQEVKKLGIAYWHQLHQQPCIVTCIQHQIPLLEINIPFRERQTKFLLPQDAKLLRHKAACSTNNIKTAIAIANIQSNLIRDKQIYNWNFVQQMLVYDHTINQSPGLLDDSVKTLGNDSASLENHIRFELISVGTSKEYMAAKIFTNFGTYDLFKNLYLWHFTMNRGITLSEDKGYVDIQTRLRNICLEFYNQNPASTRTDLWKFNTQCARWLTKYDSTWLAKVSPYKTRDEITPTYKQQELFSKRKRNKST